MDPHVCIARGSQDKLDIYEKSAERDAVFPVASYHMLKHEVKVLESVFNPWRADGSFLESPIAKKAYAAYGRNPESKRPRLSSRLRTAAPR